MTSNSAGHLIDSCGWIEWLTNGVLADNYQPYFTNFEHILVPTCVQFELYKWVQRERDESTALKVIGLTEQCSVIQMDTHIALTAADLANRHRLSFADAVIYATATQRGTKLVTSDNHFEGLDNVIYFDKADSNFRQGQSDNDK